MPCLKKYSVDELYILRRQLEDIGNNYSAAAFEIQQRGASAEAQCFLNEAQRVELEILLDAMKNKRNPSSECKDCAPNKLKENV